MFKKLKNKNGYISIEAIVLIALVLIFSVGILNFYGMSAKDVGGKGVEAVFNAHMDFLGDGEDAIDPDPFN